ncbi:hypothetical protein ACJX0J_025722 [Zea mays]
MRIYDYILFICIRIRSPMLKLYWCNWINFIMTRGHLLLLAFEQVCFTFWLKKGVYPFNDNDWKMKGNLSDKLCSNLFGRVHDTTSDPGSFGKTSKTSVY